MARPRVRDSPLDKARARARHALAGRASPTVRRNSARLAASSAKLPANAVVTTRSSPRRFSPRIRYSRRPARRRRQRAHRPTAPRPRRGRIGAPNFDRDEFQRTTPTQLGFEPSQEHRIPVEDQTSACNHRRLPSNAPGRVGPALACFISRAVLTAGLYSVAQ